MSNYKFLVKAVSSRDESVVSNFIDLVLIIGQFDSYAELYRS